MCQALDSFKSMQVNWDQGSGGGELKPVATVVAHTANCTNIAIDSKADHFATGAYDGSVSIWCCLSASHQGPALPTPARTLTYTHAPMRAQRCVEAYCMDGCAGMPKRWRACARPAALWKRCVRVHCGVDRQEL